jgi:hypothetical protein
MNINPLNPPVSGDYFLLDERASPPLLFIRPFSSIKGQGIGTYGDVKMVNYFAIMIEKD